MTHRESAVLFIRVPPVPAEVDAEWNEWYDKVHTQDRMDKPHFLSARRYRVPAGETRWFLFYELSSVDAMTSPEYLALRDRETSRPPGSLERLGPSLPGFERGVYEQIYGPQWPAAAIEAPVVYVAGHDPQPGAEAAFNAWYEGAHARAPAGIPGVLALRRFRLTSAPMTAQSGKKTTRPQYVAAYYLAAEAVAQSDAFKREIEATWASGHSGPAAPFTLLGRCIYAVAAAQPNAGASKSAQRR